MTFVLLFLLCVLINMTGKGVFAITMPTRANKGREWSLWKRFYDWRIRPTSGAFYVRLNWSCVVYGRRRTSTFPKISCSSGHPKIIQKMTPSRVRTVMHNARKKTIYIHSIFRASKICFCIYFFVYLILMKARGPCQAEKKKKAEWISILKYSIWMKWIKKFIDCHTWLQTCNKHVHRFAQSTSDGLNKSRDGKASNSILFCY